MNSAVRFPIVTGAVLGWMALGATSSVSYADPVNRGYQLQISRAEARDTLTSILDNLRIRSSSVGETERARTAHEMSQLLNAYRLDRSVSLTSISEAPFTGFLVSQQVPLVYGKAYDERYATEYERAVVKLDPIVIYDAFLGIVASGVVPKGLPPSISKASKSIGAACARKALADASDPKGCPLNPKLAAKSPSVLSMVPVMLDCRLHLHFYRSCETRRRLFEYAKPMIAEASRDVPGQPNALRETMKREFPKVFPAAFRTGFVQEISALREGFNSKVVAKFKGVDGPFWGESAPLLETEKRDPERYSMKGIGTGLRADSASAALLVGSADAVERGEAAALLYASANRLLVLMGGSEVAWDGKRKEFRVQAGNYPDPSNPKAPPVFEMSAFGGFGVEKQSGIPVFSNWDWGAYDPDPTPPAKPTPLRLFPNDFQVGLRVVPKNLQGQAPVESLDDLAELIRGSVEFLRATRRDSPLGRFFSDSISLDDLTNSDVPAIFPRDGRMLAVGLIAGAAANLAVTGRGHFEQDGASIRFHDRLRLEGRVGNPVPVEAVAHLMMGAADLIEELKDDADLRTAKDSHGDLIVPKLEEKLYNAVQIGTFALGAQAQSEKDGGFVDYLGADASLPRNLRGQVSGLRALTRVYNVTKIPLFLVRLKSGWNFMSRLWIGDSELPVTQENETQVRPIPPSVLWELVNLWDDTQPEVRALLATDVDWKTWEPRMESLRKRLLEQLGTMNGPVWAPEK